MKRVFAISIGALLLIAASVLFMPAQPGGTNPHGNLRWDCQSCHTSTSWTELRRPLAFNHDQTGFPLVGAHDEVQCISCHQSLKFAEIGVACADCHTDAHRGQLGLDCQSCHTPRDWANQQSILELHASRGFPLLGPHAVADCQACHINEQRNEFTGAPVECSGCHLSNFTLTENPNHPRAGFDLDCMSCHEPVAATWKQTTYEHTQTFALRGAHLEANCNSCHESAFVGLPTECAGCHIDAYQASFDPPHAEFGFPTDCQRCHNESRWQDATFDHLEVSGFELQEAHALARCTSCHVNNQLTGLPRDCFGCHESDFNGVTDPNHVQGNFPHDCMVCHNQSVWRPATFDHNLTGFPLTGAHVSLDCNACHAGGFTGTPSDCFSCHESDFNGVTDPNHVQNNFSHNCMVCHTTEAWSPSSFDHNQTNFPLTGAHVPLDCNACHAGGFTGTPTDCYACHQNDYNNTNNPNHQAAGFPTDCQACHNTSAWNQTTWDHDGQYFPIYSGKHRGKWNTCADCHVDPNNYAVFECIFCHEHNQQDMDREHQGVSGYVYQSQACYNCHPRGDEGPVIRIVPRRLDRIR